MCLYETRALLSSRYPIRKHGKLVLVSYIASATILKSTVVISGNDSWATVCQCWITFQGVTQSSILFGVCSHIKNVYNAKVFLDNTYITHQKHDTHCNVLVQHLYISYSSALIQTQTQSSCQTPYLTLCANRFCWCYKRDICENTKKKKRSKQDFRSRRETYKSFGVDGEVSSEQY